MHKKYRVKGELKENNWNICCINGKCIFFQYCSSALSCSLSPTVLHGAVHDVFIIVNTEIACPVLIYSRWKTHKWRKCQLVPWFLRQDSPGAQETCGPGLQTRGLESNLFIFHIPVHLHWTIPDHSKLNFSPARCVWSLATRWHMDVPRFREKVKLLGAHIKFLVLIFNKKQHKLTLKSLKM